MFLLWIKSIFAIHKGTIIFFYPDKLKKLLGSILKFFIPFLCGAALFWTGICTVIWTCTRSESFYNLKLIIFGSFFL